MCVCVCVGCADIAAGGAMAVNSLKIVGCAV